DQEFMTLLARQAAVAYQNLILLDEVSHTKMLLESLLVSLTGGLIAADLKQQITIFNPSAAGILHLPARSYVGRPAHDVLQEFPAFLKILQETYSTKTTVSRQETVLSIAGQEAKIGYTTILITDPQKIVLGSGIIFQRLGQ